jgi:predicted TIM-barrel enzyme
MAYGDANAIVVEMAGEVLPVVAKTPVLAGVNGTDPFRDMDAFLDQLKALGFSGVQNFPTVGIIDGVFRANLEETGMSYALEIDMIAKAHDKDMLTTPYVFSEAQATAMAIAGADIIVCHLGLTTGGSIGARTAPKLEQCPEVIDTWASAALSVNADILVLAHGGPIAEPADADFIMKHTSNCHGFYGASSMERLPVERALIEQVRKFKAIGARQRA